MVLLPRLARRLNTPAIATVLAVLLIAVGILGLVTDDIRTGYAAVVLIVGIVNLVRALPYGHSSPAAGDYAEAKEPPP